MGTMSDDATVIVRTDEAGDFNFSSPARLWIGVVAGVVIPDRCWCQAEDFIAAICDELGTKELKGKDLSGPQLVRVGQFIAKHDIRAAAIATDSRIFSSKEQAEWRDRQFQISKDAAARSHRAKTEPEVAERVERVRRRANNLRHVSAADYLQYAILTPWLLSRLFSAALVSYRALPPDEDSWRFDIALDAKEGADPGKAGEMMRDSLEAIFAGDDRTALLMPFEWAPDHPFKVKNSEDSGKVSVRKVLSGGISSGESHDDAGIQLADVVAHVVLGMVRETPDPDAIAAWGVLRDSMFPTDEGFPIKAWGGVGDSGGDDDEARYRRLIEPG